MSVLNIRFRYYCIAPRIFVAGRPLSETDTAESGHRHGDPGRGSQSQSNILFPAPELGLMQVRPGVALNNRREIGDARRITISFL
jgi:hypothetical protein